MSSRCCLRLTMCGCHDHTLTELSSLRLQSPWEMSGRFPDGSLGSWVEPVGTFSSSCYRGRRVHGQLASPSSFLKYSSAFLLGTRFFVPPSFFPYGTCWGPNNRSWIFYPASASQVLGLWVLVSTSGSLWPFSILASSPISLLPCIRMQSPFGALYWRHLLWFLNCFSCLKSGNMIFPFKYATHLSESHSGTKAWLKAQVLLASLRWLSAPDREPQQVCAWPDLSSVLVLSSLCFSCPSFQDFLPAN